jgi:NADH-quinone oxidoreductase subunit L
MFTPWILLLAPLVSAMLIGGWLWRKHFLATVVSIAACTASFIIAIILFLDQYWQKSLYPFPFHWISIPTPGGGRALEISIGWFLDPLSCIMLLVVTGVGLLVHIFSIDYMAHEPGRGRYFGELSLFMFSMLGIVISNNFIMMFIFWELVGLSSYLLIGYWHEKPAAAAAAKKAFIVNRLGDFGFIIGILMFWSFTGTFLFSSTAVEALRAQPPELLAAMALLLFCGCVGKSAMVPLHVWLPDAMEGPTPVSALIHAATMVAAGVYMLVRIFFILQLSPLALTVIAYIGGATALLAALIATQQHDIKRILAYSTLSQLGLMVMAVGCGVPGTTPGAAMFHLTTHAFFKALLFLGAGSILIALHHEQDIWKMGGLWKKMPVTFATFIVGSLALAGCPGLSGFFSKEEILLLAAIRQPAFLWLGLGVSALTAFYMTRLCLVVFGGSPRGKAVGHAHEPGLKILSPLVVLAALSAIGGYIQLQSYFQISAAHTPQHTLVLILSIGAFLLGSVSAWLLYHNATEEKVRINLFIQKFYFDEFYDRVLVRFQQAVARILSWFDNWIIGGFFVRGSALLGTCAGEALRLLQAGSVHAYVFLFCLGSAFILYFALI